MSGEAELRWTVVVDGEVREKFATPGAAKLRALKLRRSEGKEAMLRYIGERKAYIPDFTVEGGEQE